MPVTETQVRAIYTSTWLKNNTETGEMPGPIARTKEDAEDMLMREMGGPMPIRRYETRTVTYSDWENC